MKVCTRCDKEKLESEFHKASREPDGLKYWCKECQRSYGSMYRKRKPARKIRVVRKRHFHWRHELKHQKKTKSNYTPAESAINCLLRKRYGITLKTYNSLLEKQNGVCAICGRGPGKRRLHVDHCHKTGKVRELLCSNCNSALGKVGDNIGLLNKLIEYLGKHEITIHSPT